MCHHRLGKAPSVNKAVALGQQLGIVSLELYIPVASTGYMGCFGAVSDLR